MLSALREAQIPLLAVLLIGGCAAKAGHAFSARRIQAAIGPSSLFPLRLRRPFAVATTALELFLGVALLVTAGPFGAGIGAMAVRSLTALLFVTAVGIAHELRGRRPEAGCGCFGDLSHTPVSWRVLARSALLATAAVGTVTVGPLHWPVSPGGVCVVLGIAVAEAAVLAVLSPEIGEIMVRLGYSEPCELRRIPVPRTLAALHASAQWRRHRRYLTDTEPSDVWREGCWRFAVFPGLAEGRAVDVVFAVYMQSRRPAVRAAMVDATTDQTLASHPIPLQRSAPPPSADLYSSIKETQY
ncbi:MAG: methylamine utilization protein MauD [Nocardiopsaceae bacterium]|nr:methylamine utilization protein MauD [Nocardiopsaceae bacterium]